jgi:hypothetical protein
MAIISRKNIAGSQNARFISHVSLHRPSSSLTFSLEPPVWETRYEKGVKAGSPLSILSFMVPLWVL